eukprot:gnl/TRDRNA2_/TRDRNA2_165127_c0_seq1.p1 gnl/TRDRNA2_/TRDRNA2_165127_c0~~gnl/TRDRNA2_/TRDRNA2_165127_c0_seq1.p1  ORF type:complete len:267 (+),score=53.92 gnl/TRDRNA2_/TRDRNA2_165127_c0_seq1:107-802(+)
MCPMLSSTYCSMKAAKQAYWIASLVGIVHALTVVALAARALSKDAALFTSNDFFANSSESLQCCHCFLGYIISDFVFAVYYNKSWDGWMAMCVHHVFICICWSQLIEGRYGQVFALVAALCEASTPFVNCRWILYECGMQKSRLYLVNGLTMVAAFFILRIVGFSWMGVKLVMQREGLLSIPVLKWASLVLCWAVGFVLQIFWFHKMFMGALKALGIIAKSSKKAEATKAE